MSVNLLQTCKDALGNSWLEQASKYLGEPMEHITSAANFVLPAILGGLVKKVSEPHGKEDVSEYLKGTAVNPTILEEVDTQLEGGELTTALLDNGSSQLDFIFGKYGAIRDNLVDLITTNTELARQSATVLNQMAAPLLTATIQRHVEEKGLNPLGLRNLLQEQKEHLQSDAPQGLFDKIGLTFLSRAAQDPEPPPQTVPQKTTGPPPSTTSEENKEDPDPEQGTPKEDSQPSRIFPWIILVTLAILMWFGMRTCGGQDRAAEELSLVQEKEKEAASMDQANLDQQPSSTTPISEGAASAPDSQIRFTSRNVTEGVAVIRLPDGKSVQVAEASIVDQLYNFIISDAPEPSPAYSWDGQPFAEGTANLLLIAAAALDKLSDLLTAFPEVHLLIEAYANDAGDQKIVGSLIEQRAFALQQALHARGIATGRLEVKGNDGQNRTADDPSETASMQKKHIDLYVTKK